MSFKEIKSLLRMVNVDMNGMYAYRLFKVQFRRVPHTPFPIPASGTLALPRMFLFCF